MAAVRFDCPDGLWHTLKKCHKDSGVTYVAETIRDAIVFYDWARVAIRNGNYVASVSPDGKIEAISVFSKVRKRQETVQLIVIKRRWYHRLFKPKHPTI